MKDELTQIIARNEKQRQQAEEIIQSITIPDGLNENQKNTLFRVIKEIPGFDFYNSDDYEVKEMNIKIPETYGHVSVSFTTGMKGDEGSLAVVFCRKRRLFWIGKRGGILVMNSKYNINPCSLFDLMNKEYYH